jgi:hypothetical protein
VREWVKILGVTAPLGCLSADVGIRTAVILGCPQYLPSDQQHEEGRTANPQTNSLSSGGTPTNSEFDTPYWCAKAVEEQKRSDRWFWGVLTGLKITDILLTVFSGLLVYVGIQQLSIYAGQRQIMGAQLDILKSQADLEIPRLFCLVRDNNFVEAIEHFVAQHYTIHETVMMRIPPMVTFRLHNYGRSPAILRFINVKVQRRQTPPSEDTSYAITDLPPERVLGRDDVTSDMTTGASIFKDGAIRRSEYDMLMRAQTYWWFFGSVGFDDVWTGKNVLHFCWRYDQSIRVFDPYPPERNYTERKPADSHGKSSPP